MHPYFAGSFAVDYEAHPESYRIPFDEKDSDEQGNLLRQETYIDDDDIIDLLRANTYTDDGLLMTQTLCNLTPPGTRTHFYSSKRGTASLLHYFGKRTRC